MNDAERAAMIALVKVIEGIFDMVDIGNRKGHMPSCDYGIFTGNAPSRTHPNGAPHSKRCIAAREAVEMGRAVLSDQQTAEKPLGSQETLL